MTTETPKYVERIEAASTMVKAAFEDLYGLPVDNKVRFRKGGRYGDRITIAVESPKGGLVFTYVDIRPSQTGEHDYDITIDSRISLITDRHQLMMVAQILATRLFKSFGVSCNTEIL